MESVQLIAQKGITVHDFWTMLKPFYEIQDLTERNQITIVNGQRHAFFYQYEWGEEFDDLEMEQIHKMVKDPIIFSLASSNHDFLREVLQHLDFDGLIDDAFGKIWKARDFIEKLRADTQWDWRVMKD